MQEEARRETHSAWRERVSGRERTLQQGSWEQVERLAREGPSRAVFSLYCPFAQ